MRSTWVCALAILAGAQVACPVSRHEDASVRLDASTPPDSEVSDGSPWDVNAPGALEPCSVDSFDVLSSERTYVTPQLCFDPLEGNTRDPVEVMPDGLVWYAIDTFVPLAIATEGETVVLEGLLAHRPDDAILRECTIGVDCPPTYLLGFRVRYRIRLDGAAPFAALEEASPVDPESVVAEIRAAGEETDCDTARGSWTGRLVCTSAARWDVWSHAARAPHADENHDDVLRILGRWREPTLLSVALIDREARAVWWIGLQGLPDDCEHPRDMPYEEPCQPLLQPSGAHAMFAVPGSAFCTECSGGGGVTYCPLELSCASCCPPAMGFAEYYACRDRGFCQGSVDSAWLEAACAATRLGEVPPAPAVPCPEGRWAGCPMDQEDGVCP